MFCYILHHAGIKTFEQCYSLCKTLLEINLTTHCSGCYLSNLLSHSSSLGKLINTLSLNKSRVHIKTDETT